MDLISRPWSINSYALSKIWHRAHTVDLRTIDINKINSKVKSWLFQDQLEKPEECVLYRPIYKGGLGMHNIKIRSNSLLIKTFLETAVNPMYQHSLFHSLIYRFYILNDDTIENPPQLPHFLSESIINNIKYVKENTPLNVERMSVSQWYRVLLENEIMERNNQGYLDLIKVRAEISSPATDWDVTWRRARLRGIGPEALSFVWKMIHNVLPTEARLARILPNSSEFCKFCPNQVYADLPHCLLECVLTREVGNWLVSLISQHDSTVNAKKLLRLEFCCNASLEFPLVWLTAHTLCHSWSSRRKSKNSNVEMTRAMLEHKITLLRETRFRNVCGPIEALINHVN